MARGASVMSDLPLCHASRKDIQVLRGIAVVQVVLYHAGFPYLPAGYLGVDIFFVISGYLVTRMVLDRIESGHFSFGEFYLRRAKRLLPASSCTLVVATLAATILLSAPEFEEFVKQLIGAIAFSANIVLWKQSGYFDEVAVSKPLLHWWSLSLEEQYYFLLPLFLVLLPRHWRLKGTGIALVVSICLCFVAVGIRPAAAFYLLPTRAWELLVGSVCAIGFVGKSARVPRPLLVVALLLLLLVPGMGFDTVHPRGDALLVTLATAILLLGRSRALQSGPLTAGFARIGDWSYSLYLVHWPLFVFASSAYVGGALPGHVRTAIVAVSFVLAFLQYRFVEERFRNTNAPPTRFILSVAGICMAAVLIAFGYSYYERTTGFVRDFGAVRRTNFGLGAECSYSGKFTEKSSCMTSKYPRVAVWGDSFAMHLVPGLLVSSFGSALVQVTQSSCGPVLELAIVQPSGSEKTAAAAASCIRFNRSAFDYLTAQRSVEYVIMSSPLDYMLDTGSMYLSGDEVVRVNDRLLLERYAATIEALRRVGKKVIIVAPTPTVDFNIGLCQERLESGRPIIGRTTCDFKEAAYLTARRNVVAFLQELERTANVTVLWPKDALCLQGVCRAVIDGKFVYRDAGHFSHEGSVAFQKIFALDEKVLRFAR
jgi:peptidoglycan/LPS O-acetylase OafA/YrhL